MGNWKISSDKSGNWKVIKVGKMPLAAMHRDGSFDLAFPLDDEDVRDAKLMLHEAWSKTKKGRKK